MYEALSLRLHVVRTEGQEVDMLRSGGGFGAPRAPAAYNGEVEHVARLVQVRETPVRQHRLSGVRMRMSHTRARLP